MPIFDYKCEECNYTEEVLLSINEQPDVKCPDCDSIMVRMVAAPSIESRVRVFNKEEIKKHEPGGHSREYMGDDKRKMRMWPGKNSTAPKVIKMPTGG